MSATIDAESSHTSICLSKVVKYIVLWYVVHANRGVMNVLAVVDTELVSVDDPVDDGLDEPDIVKDVV